MFTLTAECTLCSSHQPSVDGEAASPLHGHNFRVVAIVEAEETTPCGFVLRPGRLREALWEVAEPFDHRHLNDLEPFVGEGAVPPTPAQLARVIAERLAPRIEGSRVRLRRVEVWPGPLRCVAWEAQR